MKKRRKGEPALIDEIRRERVVPARSHQAVRRLPLPLKKSKYLKKRSRSNWLLPKSRFFS